MAVSKYDIKLDLAKHPGTSRAFLVNMVGANKRVLDIGCDTGYLGEELAAFGNVTSGFEFSAAAAEIARGTYQRVEVGDLETVDLAAAFDHAQFDVIVFGDVLEHLRDPLPVLRQARPMVAPGGCVLISVPNVSHGDIRLNLLRGQFRYTKIGLLDDTHTRFFTRASLIDFVQDAGFTIIEMKRTRRALFKTEVGLAREDFDPALVATLENDIEATTYQFVVRIAPDDAVHVTSEQAVMVDSLTAELAQERRQARDLRARQKALSARVDELTDSLKAGSQRAGPVSAGRLRRALKRRAKRALGRRLSGQP